MSPIMSPPQDGGRGHSTDGWIPAFAGMTLRTMAVFQFPLTEGRDSVAVRPMRKLRISGLVEFAKQVRQELAGPVSAERLAQLRGRSTRPSGALSSSRRTKAFGCRACRCPRARLISSSRVWISAPSSRTIHPRRAASRRTACRFAACSATSTTFWTGWPVRLRRPQM